MRGWLLIRPLANVGELTADATRNQGDGTPHGHGFVSLANMYQHHSLKEIAELLEARYKEQGADCMERLTGFFEHLRREDHYDDEAHQASLPELEREFHENYSDYKTNFY